MFLFLSLMIWMIQTEIVLAGSYDRVLLSEVQTLTFYKDRETTGRRSAPRPQIECRGGCGQYFPEEMQCYNRGTDGFDVNWECRSNLPNHVQLSRVVVGCEGYDHPNDPYILRGSCQVIVSLKNINGGSSSYSSGKRTYSTESGGGGMSIWSLILSLAFVYIIYKIFQHFQSQQSPQPYPSPPPVSAYGSNGWGWGNPFGSGWGWGNPFGFGGFNNLGWLGLLSMMPRRSPYRFGYRPFGRRRYFGTNSMGFSNSYDRGNNGRSSQTSFATTERR